MITNLSHDLSINFLPSFEKLIKLKKGFTSYLANLRAVKLVNVKVTASSTGSFLSDNSSQTGRVQLS